MHAVFRLVELSGLCAKEDVIADFHGFKTVFLIDLFTDFCFTVMEGGQTMQEDGILICRVEQLLVDLIRMQKFNPLCPELIRLTH